MLSQITTGVRQLAPMYLDQQACRTALLMALMQVVMGTAARLWRACSSGSH